MREKESEAREKIIVCAKAEFMRKGFAEASMRSIAEQAGCTTGLIYARFADKEALFREIVGEGAEKLYGYFLSVQEEFAAFSAERQKAEMHAYTDGKTEEMIGIIYDYFDSFKLIVCKSAGSSYEKFIHSMVEVETRNTYRFIRDLKSSGIEINDIREDMSHMLASALFNGIFETVAHDFPKEDALSYVRQLQLFFNAGWDRLLGL